MHTETCNLARADLLMNPDRMQKQATLAYFIGENRPRKTVGANMGIFKPSERPHSSLDACSRIDIYLCHE